MHPPDCILLLLELSFTLLLVYFARGQCNSGQYPIYDPSSQNISCLNCSDSCQTCFGNLSDSYCTACNQFTYYNSTDYTCSNCPKDCISCSTSASVCENCKPGYVLEIDQNNIQTCVLYWWRIFFIVLGVVGGLLLVALVVYCLRKKLNNEDAENALDDTQQIQQNIRAKYEVTETNLKS